MGLMSYFELDKNANIQASMLSWMYSTFILEYKQLRVKKQFYKNIYETCIFFV